MGFEGDTDAVVVIGEDRSDRRPRGRRRSGYGAGHDPTPDTGANEELERVVRAAGPADHLRLLDRVALDPGEAGFLRGEQMDRARVLEANDRLAPDGKRPAVADPMLRGITKASLATESFISAASFQETTRVLTEAAVRGMAWPAFADLLEQFQQSVFRGPRIKDAARFGGDGLLALVV